MQAVNGISCLHPRNLPMPVLTYRRAGKLSDTLVSAKLIIFHQRTKELTFFVENMLRRCLMTHSPIKETVTELFRGFVFCFALSFVTLQQISMSNT